ncbi:hypothetical protein B0B39_00705 [Legionella longbeachae]|nr:hypothetical protein B0B39_00705 [Legionella longbeachae]
MLTTLKKSLQSESRNILVMGLELKRIFTTEQHEEGKTNTQKIEGKFLTLMTCTKRLTRKTICFSKSELMHDSVIGLLINKFEFQRDV